MKNTAMYIISQSQQERSSLFTLSAIFFSLFIAENCFSRDSTAESSGLSGAEAIVCSHGWPGNKNN